MAAYSVIIATLTNLWLSRDTLSGYAPDGTVAIIHLTLTQNVYERLAQDFGQTTLVSGRHLTLQDLKDLACKEASLFILEDGTKAVAVRVSKDNLPGSLLDAYSIASEPIGKHAFLLSHTVLPAQKHGGTTWSLTSLFSNKMADISLKADEGWTKTALIKTSYGYSIKLPRTGLSQSGIPDDGKIIASGMLPQGSSKELRNLWSVLDRFISPLGLVSTAEISQNIADFGASFAIRRSDSSAESLLAFKQGAVTIDPKRFVRTVAAIRQPQTRSLVLPDGTTAKEIFIDPSSIVIEELIFQGYPAFRTRFNENMIYAVVAGQDLILSTNEEILKFWLKKDENVEATSCSKSSALLIRPQLFSDFSMSKALYETQNSFLDITRAFKQISLNSGKISDSIRLCY